MSICAEHLRKLIVRTLIKIPEWYSDDAVELLMLTISSESDCGKYLTQLGGPALGIVQMEPSTLRDIWANWLAFRPDKRAEVIAVTGVSTPCKLALEGNLLYGILMARVQYLRNTEPLPSKSDQKAMARYYVKYYNRGGAADELTAIAKYRFYCL